MFQDLIALRKQPRRDLSDNTVVVTFWINWHVQVNTNLFRTKKKRKFEENKQPAQ